MSHTAIDPLFQVTAPAPSGREAARAATGGSDLFRSHLDRAAEAAEPKPVVSNDVIEPKGREEGTQFDPQTGEQEKSTTEQEQAATDSGTPIETAEEAPPEEKSTDEVTLSAAAAQQAEPTVEPEQAVSTEGIVETSFAEGQQQPEGQATAEVAETSNNATVPTTESETVELDSALLTTPAAGETASEDGEVRQATKISIAKSETDVQPVVGQPAATASAVERETKKAQSSITPSNSQDSLDSQSKQTTASKTLDALPEGDAKETSTQAASRRFEVPVATNHLASADAELALANLASTAEATVDSPPPSASATSSETIATAGRTLGTLLAGKTANAASATGNETSTPETPTVDRARFVHRVGGAIRSAQLREGQIQIRLSPPELGTLQIRIVMNEGVLTAHLETETAAARTVLLDNLPALRERLAEQEIRIDKFDVDVGREGHQQTDDPETNDHQPNNARSQANQSSNREQGLGVTAAESDVIQHATASGLDVRI